VSSACGNLDNRMDSVDLRILLELQRDAKLTNVELARRVHLSPSPCLTRVRSLEKAGVIRRYVTLLDPRAIGLGVSVFMQITLEKQHAEVLARFEEAIQRIPEIMECYLIAGSADYLLRVVVPDVAALNDFIANTLGKIPGVANIRSSFTLKQVKA